MKDCIGQELFIDDLVIVNHKGENLPGKIIEFKNHSFFGDYTIIQFFKPVDINHDLDVWVNMVNEYSFKSNEICKPDQKTFATFVLKNT